MQQEFFFKIDYMLQQRPVMLIGLRSTLAYPLDRLVDVGRSLDRMFFRPYSCLIPSLFLSVIDICDVKQHDVVVNIRTTILPTRPSAIHSIT